MRVFSVLVSNLLLLSLRIQVSECVSSSLPSNNWSRIVYILEAVRSSSKICGSIRIGYALGSNRMKLFGMDPDKHSSLTSSLVRDPGGRAPFQHILADFRDTVLFRWSKILLPRIHLPLFGNN